MQRIPVLSKENIPLMPTKPSKARKLVSQKRAEVVLNDLGVFCIRLKFIPSGFKTQKITIGIDPGSCFTGIAIVSKLCTFLGFNLDLPREKISKRLEERRVLRRTRRSRRIKRSIPFELRNHRQKRFSNRKGNILPPSIKASKELELRVVSELVKLFPVTNIWIEKLTTSSSKGFTRAAQGQNWLVKKLEEIYPTVKLNTTDGFETSKQRKHLGLEKCKDKSKKDITAHVNDAIAIASFEYLRYQFLRGKEGGYKGKIELTLPDFFSVFRLKSRPRKLHDIQFKKGGKRRTYGGYGSKHGFKNGDVVRYFGRKLTLTGRISANDLYDLCLTKRIKQGVSRKSSVKVRSSSGIICNKIPLIAKSESLLLI